MAGEKTIAFCDFFSNFSADRRVLLPRLMPAWFTKKAGHYNPFSAVAIQFRDQIGGFSVQLFFKVLELFACVLKEELAIHHKQKSKDIEEEEQQAGLGPAVR
jgi:hypothetical protein